MLRCYHAINKPRSLLRLPLLHNLRNRAFQRVLPPKPQKRRKINNRVIEQDKSTEDPEIPPLVAIVDTESPPKLISIRILAELADSVLTNLYIAAHLLDIGLGI